MAEGSQRMRILAVLLFGAATSNVHAACDLQSLKGDYWFVANGTARVDGTANSALLPFSEIGRVSYDGKGGATLTETVAMHATQSETKAVGTYLVSADCRASVQWKLGGGRYLESYAMIVLPGATDLPTVAFRLAQAGEGRTLSQFTQKKL